VKFCGTGQAFLPEEPESPVETTHVETRSGVSLAEEPPSPLTLYSPTPSTATASIQVRTLEMIDIL
jgi:hypothetical protein